MKIAYFIDHLRGDGTQRVLTQLVAGLAARGHLQTIFCLNHSYNAALVQQLRETGARVQIVGAPALFLGLGALRIVRELQRAEIDVAITFLFYADVIGRTLARTARIPRIVTSIRARNVNYASWMLLLSRATMHWANAVILNSTAVAEFSIAHEGVRRDTIRIIPNGLDVRLYQRPLARDALRREFGIALESPVVGSVGRLTPQKGYDVLLDALAKLPAPRPALLLMGEGEERGALQARAERLGLAVHFAGYCYDVPKVLGALDVYVQPSRFEGMPNAVLEAMAAGCPIVATAVDGTCELIEDGVHGWLVPPEDANALAGTLARVLVLPHEAARRGAAARTRAQRVYSLDGMIVAWERVLQDA